MDKKNILIVEDENIIGLELKKNLDKEGYSSRVVNTPEDAISAVEEYDPDLILMDIRLQQDRDGIQTANEIKKIRSNIPHIFVSALTDEDTITRARKTNPAGFLVKPVDEKELYTNIAIVLQKYELERKLKEIGDRYRALYSDPDLCILIIGFDEQVIEANNTLSLLLGYSKEELLQLTLESALSEDGLKEAREIIKSLWDDKHGNRRAIFNVRRKDGKILLIDADCSVIERSNNSYAIQVIARDITEKVRTEQAINQSEQKYRTLFERMAQGVIYFDSDGRLTSYNPAAEKILGVNEETVSGRTIFELPWTAITPEGIKFSVEEYPSVIALKEGKEVNNKIMGISNLKNKELKWLDVSAVPLFREGERKPHQVFITFEDITDLKNSKKQVEAALREKEALIKEVHHRVKNNFQVISSLLSLQSDQFQDTRSLDLFNESRNRIRIMAMIHELLYQTTNFSQISSFDYITRLIHYLKSSYNVDTDHISIKADIEDQPLSIDSATCCGQIINELISNSCKYAFPEGRAGEIKVDFKRQDDKYILKISDNGIGFPHTPDIENIESLGLSLVSTFVMQLRGNLELNTQNGTEYIISFKEE